MSGINNRIEQHLQAVRQDPLARPIIDRVKRAAASEQVSSGALLDVAVSATVDEFKRQGRPVDANAVREQAYLAAAAASTEQSMELSDLPAGDDKTKHFFVSGLLSIKIANVADKLLPRSWSEKLGAAASFAIGFGKEVYDGFNTWRTKTGTGFNREDLQADAAGAKRPFDVRVPKA